MKILKILIKCLEKNLTEFLSILDDFTTKCVKILYASQRYQNVKMLCVFAYASAIFVIPLICFEYSEICTVVSSKYAMPILTKNCDMFRAKLS